MVLCCPQLGLAKLLQEPSKDLYLDMAQLIDSGQVFSRTVFLNDNFGNTLLASFPLRFILPKRK